MNADQIALIPDRLLAPSRRGAVALMEFLAARGWRMSLLELDTERRDRGIQPKH